MMSAMVVDTVRPVRARGTSRARGFTLIEMAIVVLIISILTAIAVPAYNDSVRKGRRGQAKTDLVQVAQFMERCFTASNTYQNCVAGGNALVAPQNVSPQQGTAAYTIALGNISRTTYTVTATRVGDQLKDRGCGNLGLTHTGVRSVTTGTVADCF